MKIKMLFLCALTALLLTSCQLAVPEKKSGTDKRLVGVLITNEYLDLFNMESYLNDNLNAFNGGEIKLDGNQEKYEGRLYANFNGKDNQEVKFGNINGIPFFAAEFLNENGETSTVSYNGDGMVDSKFAVFNGDDEDKITLEGTVYIVPGINGQQHYINPVYQSSDGKIFAQSGNGISLSGVQSQGDVMSQKLEETVTVTQNGISKKKTAVINLSIETMLPPQKITLTQMDINNQIIKSDEYIPGKLPQSINADINTSFIIMQTNKTDFDGKILTKHKLYSKEDTAISTFFKGDKNILSSQYTQLIWGN